MREEEEDIDEPCMAHGVSWTYGSYHCGIALISACICSATEEDRWSFHGSEYQKSLASRLRAGSLLLLLCYLFP